MRKCCQAYCAKQSCSAMKKTRCLIIFLLLATQGLVSLYAQPTKAVGVKAERVTGAKPLNVIFILTDDHRYDFMGFTGKVPWLQTPNMDKLANEGAWIKNATVTTALCSPSRASILSGQYAHTHKVIDNFSPLPKNLVFFPEYLQQAGYNTAFFGKWHMGDVGDQPQKGFNHWESFKGQGIYFNPLLNINGKHVQYKDSTYITDLLADHATEWIKQQNNSKPFFLYLSHKGVHDEFMPAPRHKGLYRDKPITYPSTINLTATNKTIGDLEHSPTADMVKGDTNYNTTDIPAWVRTQRNSWHGVDFMYNGRVNFDEFYRRYCETLLSVDESIGKVIATLREKGLDQNTVIIYMGDNGFLMGEHGLIDKRNMYEESQKVPMLVYAPSQIKPGQVLEQVIQNIDVAPTILQMAGLKTPAQMQGKSFLPLLKGKQVAWRDKAFYEYYWEFLYPQTPTTFGVRSGRYKFIFYPGIWDVSEFFDLQTDPEEKKNLYRVPAYQPLIKQLRSELWDWLEQTGGMQIPLKRIDQYREDYYNKGLY
jgi:N-acetylglucosamine-6-sulfatase